MKVTQAEFQNMKEEIIKDLIVRLIKDKNLSIRDAFDKVYGSNIFQKLSNPRTALFYQSSGYVYSYLLDELEK